jgi:hypothetical protein
LFCEDGLQVDNPKVETRVSIAEVQDNNVLHWLYRDGANVTLEEAQFEVQIVGGLVQEHIKGETKLLIDIRPVRSMDRGASKLFSSDEVHYDYRIEALALITKSYVSTLIGNFYMRVFGPLHPVRLFTAEPAAREWLGSFDG